MLGVFFRSRCAVATGRVGSAMPRPHPFGPDQESVWDYPRPPILDPTDRLVEVVFADVRVAKSSRTIRILETSHPPVHAIPPTDVRTELLEMAPDSSACEWKGVATYWTITVDGRRSEHVAWSYPRPRSGFEAIADHLCFYAGRVDRCMVEGVVVEPQPGGFYGGWITPDIAGPFKGEPGTLGW